MENIKLNSPGKRTFWVAIIIALISGILYSLQCLGVLTFPWLYPLTYLLLLIAFVLLVLGLMFKGF